MFFKYEYSIQLTTIERYVFLTRKNLNFVLKSLNRKKYHITHISHYDN